MISFSQKETRNNSCGWLLGGGPLLTNGYTKDQTFSSVPYSGIAAGATISGFNKGKRLAHSFDISYTQGIYKATNDGSYQLKSRYANFDYSLLAQLSSEAASHWYFGAGGGINILYTGREYNHFINSRTAFEFASSLSLAAHLNYKFGEAPNGFFIYNNIQLPVITYLVQPPFGYNNLIASGKSAFYSKDLVSPSSFFRIKNRFGIGKLFDSKQNLSLSYQWDFYHLQKEREVRSATHSIAITYTHSL